MKQRIVDRIAQLRSECRTGLVSYIVAGDPDPDTTLRVMARLVEAGASMLEIGMPFSDPVADGPIVAASHLRALQGGQTTPGVFDLIERFRERDSTTPVLLMGYVNPALNLGVDSFYERVARCGADGTILVDLPLEHSSPWEAAASRNEVAFVPLWAPTAPPRRECRIVCAGRELVYMVSRTGTTGSGAIEIEGLKARAKRGRDAGVPLAAGFGIRTAEQARSLAGVVDLVVVGSLNVEVLARGTDEDSLCELSSATRNLVDALGGD